MTIGNISRIGAIVASGSSAFNLDGISNVSVHPGLQEIVLSGAGQPSPSFIAAMKIDPMVIFDCSDLATLLGAMGTTSTLGYLAFPTSTTLTTLDVYMTKALDLGTIGGSSTHFRVRMNKALLILKSIKASQGNVASGQVEIHALFDGTNLPFVFGTGVSLPHTPSIDELFTVGPASVSGAAQAGVVDSNIDFGIGVQKESSDGEAYSSFCGVNQIRPKIEITFKDPTKLSTFGLAGTAQSSTASWVKLRKIKQNGDRVADGTGEHISFTTPASAGLNWVTEVSVNETSGESHVCLHPTLNSGLLTISTTDTIS